LFQLLFDPRHNVLMTRYFGTYVADDITLRDNAVARFVARRGLVRGIVDFSDVNAVDVPLDRFIKRATSPGLLGSKARVIVAPDELTYGLNRVFAAHRAYSRILEPLLVRSLAEAYEALELDDPKFEPVEVDADLEAAVLRVLSGIERAHEEAVAARSGADRERLRVKFLRLLDAVPMDRPRQPARSLNAITLGDVLNSALNRAAVTDYDLRARCAGCRKRTSLGLCKIVTGRETTYACPGCGEMLVRLASARSEESTPAPSDGGCYRLGTFLVRTHVDIECPGATLPKLEVGR
jgi:hypothetical protein